MAHSPSEHWARLRRAACCLLLALSAPVGAESAGVRVAVVGGLEMSGVWPRLAERAGAALGLDIETVAASPKEGVVPAFRRGDADLLLIHGGDEVFALEAAGYATAPRVWAWNEHVVVGPASDPAGIRDAAGGEEAMRRIAAARAPLIAFRDPGSNTIVQRLWRSGGIRPDSAWLRPDTAVTPQAILGEAAAQQAYVVVGHIPVAFGKLAAPSLAVLTRGDPWMRRPYVVLSPGARHPADVNARTRAVRLADYLVSAAGQAVLREVDAASNGPWLFPAADGLPVMGMSR